MRKKSIYILVGLLFIAIIIVLIGRFTNNKSATSSNNPASTNTNVTSVQPIILSNDPLSLTYTIDGDPVTLVKGTSETVLPDSSSTETTEIFGKPIFGDITGDGKDDAVLMVAQYGAGTGQFYYVTVAIGTPDGFRGMDSVFVGDRIAPQNISIEKSGRIAVNYADRGADEPFTTEPSFGKTLYLVYNSTGKGGLVVSK